jgi:hypothetical protein
MNLPTVCAIVLFLLLVYSRPAHAYLDPGSGSVVLQILLGGVAGVILVVKLFWHRLLAIFGIRKEDKEESKKKDQEKIT